MCTYLYIILCSLPENTLNEVWETLRQGNLFSKYHSCSICNDRKFRTMISLYISFQQMYLLLVTTCFYMPNGFTFIILPVYIVHEVHVNNVLFT